MNKDDQLMLEALQSKFTQGRGPVNDIVVSELHKMHTALNQMATMIDLNPSAEVDQLLSKIRDVADMLIADAATEDAEHEPHGYPGGVTAIQNVLINQLKKHGFTLTKISHIDKERDAYPTVFMKKSQGAMHIGAEIDGMGYINGEPFKEYMMARGYDAKNASNKPYTPSGARPDPEDPAYDTWQSIAQDHAEDAESADERKERVQRGWEMNKKRWAKWKIENPEAAAKHAAKKAGKSEDAEHRSKAQQAAIAIALQKTGKKPS